MFHGRLRRWARDALIVVTCGVVGYLVVAAPRFVDAGDGAETGRTNPRVALSDLADARDPAAPSALAETDVEAPGPAATTPVDAVRAFLAAELDGDYATSYGLLSASERADLGSHSEWEVAHGQLPAVTGFALGPANDDGTTATVEANVTFEPGLDETRGLVPRRAHGVFVAVVEDGGWRVAHSQSRLLPIYPEADGAAVAADAWVRARIACDAVGEYSGGLLGAPGPVDALCGAAGSVSVGPATALEPGAGVEPFLAAFGPDVFSWGRVVPVAAPVSLAVVLAPVGDQWVVVGALQSLPGGSS